MVTQKGPEYLSGTDGQRMGSKNGAAMPIRKGTAQCHKVLAPTIQQKKETRWLITNIWISVVKVV